MKRLIYISLFLISILVVYNLFFVKKYQDINIIDIIGPIQPNITYTIDYGNGHKNIYRGEEYLYQIIDKFDYKCVENRDIDPSIFKYNEKITIDNDPYITIIYKSGIYNFIVIDDRNSSSIWSTIHTFKCN